MTRPTLSLLILLTLTGCSCLDYGYCPALFPRADR
ncbi:hypothetical protein GobsT_51000 [Gemmata obscuriglobus]|nr:hypothetical protein GobsT_51000 [Gemmata obscuriglobus]VTS09620.1 unnamed protein product [Gemmata obscuriglobus UQM 2246]